MPWSAEDVYLLPVTGEVVIQRPVSYSTEQVQYTIGDYTVVAIVGIISGSQYPELVASRIELGEETVFLQHIRIRVL